MTARIARNRKIEYQIPIFFVLSGIGRWEYLTYLAASILISKMLFRKAKRGASGNAQEKRTAKPNWIASSM